MPPLDATRASTRARTEELTKKVDETLLPRLSKLDGLQRLLPDRAGERRHELDRLLRHHRHTPTSRPASAATWVRDEKLETVLPNPPKVTDGEVIVQKKNGFNRA